MTYEERIQALVDKGVMNAGEAKSFQDSVLRLTPPSVAVATRKKLPMTAISVITVGVFVFGISSICVSGVSSTASPETIQNVSQSLNAVAATGNMGAGVTASLALFLLFSIPAAGVLLFLSGTYNKLVEADEAVKKTESYVTAALQRRRDLVPALQDVVKQAMSYEETLHTSVTEQRTNGKAQGLAVALDGLSDTSPLAAPLSAVVEGYPQIKAQDSIRQLQDELSRIEYGLLIARNIHSEALADLNTCIRSVFGGLVAGMTGMERKINTTVSAE